MKRCWIHIGMHKTGTTSIQVNLAKVRKPAGWCFLTVGANSNMGQSLYAMFSPAPHEYHWFVKCGKTPGQIAQEGARLRRRLRKAINQCKRKTIIISGEALSLIEKEGIVALRDFLEPLCDEIRIIGYVRPPLGFRVSIFQQRMKHGKDAFNISKIKMRYRRRFEKFDEVFGQQNVVLRKFDPSAFTHQCVVTDFCEQVGIDPPAREAVSRANESLSREACGILYAYRKFGPGYSVGKNVIKENKRIITSLLAMRGSRFKLSKSSVERGLDLAKEDVRWMEHRLGTSLKEVIVDDGSEITCEEDLLTVKRVSCEDFADKFREIHGIVIPPEKLPASDPVEPRQVAEFVDYCRSLCRERIISEQTTRRKPNSWRRGFVRKCKTRLDKLFGYNKRPEKYEGG
jgi:hypothetical protein